jgi:hypothetical protein
MKPNAIIVHQTRDRLRLRVRQKRNDLAFFLEFYEQLRRTPAVEEISMNPATGSVLVHFDGRRRNTLMGALADSSLIDLSPQPMPAVGQGSQSRREGAWRERFLAGEVGKPTDARTLLFLIVLGLSIHQVLRGQFLAPALTLLMYGADFAAGRRRGIARTSGPS